MNVFLKIGKQARLHAKPRSCASRRRRRVLGLLTSKEIHVSLFDHNASSKRHFPMREHCTDPSPHQYDGMLKFATNCLGGNVANASGVSPSRNEQSSGRSH